MKPVDQIIAIATFRGLKNIRIGCHNNVEGLLIYDSSESKNGSALVPNYFTDLNAMHEAEKALTDEQALKYFEHLLDVTSRDECSMNGDPWRKRGALWAITHATATQRAEAYLKTLNL